MRRDVASKGSQSQRRDMPVVGATKDMTPKADASGSKEAASAMKRDSAGGGRKDSATPGRKDSPRRESASRESSSATSSASKRGTAAPKRPSSARGDAAAAAATAAAQAPASACPVAAPASARPAASPGSQASVNASVHSMPVVRPPSVPKLTCGGSGARSSAPTDAVMPAPAPAPAPAFAAAVVLHPAVETAAAAPGPADVADTSDITVDENGDGDDEVDVYNELSTASGGRPNNLSPVRLRMGWRRNGELETRTSELQHLLDILKPPGAPTDTHAAQRGKAPAWASVDAQVRKFESQQARLETLEREIDAHREAKNQAIASRMEMVKRLDEEKKRSGELQQQLNECRSKLSRAQRQVQLLRNPNQQAEEEQESSDKPKPLHMRLNEEQKKRDEKRDAVRQQLEQGRTYAPRIDPTSANISKENAGVRTTYAPEPRAATSSVTTTSGKAASIPNTPKTPSATASDPGTPGTAAPSASAKASTNPATTGKAAPSASAKASSASAQSSSTGKSPSASAPQASTGTTRDAGRAATAAAPPVSSSRGAEVTESAEEHSRRLDKLYADMEREQRLRADEHKAALAKISADLERERKEREAADVAMKRAVANESNAQAKREEAELAMQRMAAKERDQNAELEMARKQSKEAKNELIFAKKLAEASQLEAANHAEEARLLDRQRATWEKERIKFNNAKEEAEIQAKEALERSKSAEEALETVVSLQPPPEGAIKANRKAQGIKEHPNAEAAQRQIQKAKLEKHRLAAEEEKRARQRAERELQRAVEEQKRLGDELQRFKTQGPPTDTAEAGRASGQTASQVTHPSEASPNAKPAALKKGSSRNHLKSDGMAEMQRRLRTEVEESTLLRELGGLEGALHHARTEAHSASSVLAAEKQLRGKAEASLERFTRISALQQAASAALQSTMVGHKDEHDGIPPDEALTRAIADVQRRGGLYGERSRRTSGDSAADGAANAPAQLSARGLSPLNSARSPRGSPRPSARGNRSFAPPGAQSPRASSPRASPPPLPL